MPEGAALARRIKPLSPLLASQIAAGEVVERPASVVKELVENALDAGATRVTIELEQGGIELVKVSDDGAGIHPDDLDLALSPHATSKVSAPEDLDRIATLGFRGEALASIASVSRLTIRSRTPEHPAATLIEAHGQAAGPPRPAPGPIGTSVTVRTLFFNTPARRKFLRTVATEQSRCLDAVRDLAMGRPAVAFTVTCDARVLLDVPANQSPRERALAVLGPELAPELIEVHADEFDDTRGLALWGLVGRPSIARASNKSQHILLNGRAIRDRTIQHAIAEAYRGLIEPSRYPTAVLMLEMSPAAVDVNVHPSKAEVRFRDGSTVHQTVLNAVRRALRAADLTPALLGAFHPPSPALAGEDRAILPPATPASGLSGDGSQQPSLSKIASAQAFADFFKRFPPARAQGQITYAQLKEAVAVPPPPAPEMEPVLLQPRPGSRVLQVHNSFLVTQDEQGVLIVDQHALHERVMFEYLLARITASDLESQRLLTPVVVHVSAEQLARLDELRPLFERIGVEAEPLGPKSLAVHAFPTFLFDRAVDPLPFMADLFERAVSDKFVPDSEEALREVLDMMSCKAAVKAGDRLSEDELGALMDLRETVERSSNCPHGRPTTVRLTIRELGRLFGRT